MDLFHLVAALCSVTLLCLLASGCSPNNNPNAKRLIGKWQLMTEQQLDANNNGVDETLAKELGKAGSRVDRVVASDQLMTIEFKPAGILETSAMQVKQGTWTFQSYSDSDETLTLVCKLGAEEPVMTKVRFVSDEIVCMIPPNISVLEKELLFRRTRQ